MIIFMLASIVFILMCGCMFGTIVGIPLGIISVIGVVVYSCYKEAKAEKEDIFVLEPNLEPKPEPFYMPIVADDVLAMYCADKVANKRFKL